MTTGIFSLRTAIVACLLIGAVAVGNTQKKQETTKRTVSRTMLNGTWVIGKGATESVQKTRSDDFLPPGLRLQFKLLGPTRLAIEENRSDELGGELTFLPPIPNDICTSWFGKKLCKDGVVANPSQASSFDAVFRFSRWTRKDPEQIDNQFFAEQGAKAGALVVDITFPPTGPEWTLWIEANDELLNTYIFTNSSGDKTQAPQPWHRLHKK